MQDEAERDGALGPGQAMKLDNIAVSRALGGWRRQDRPLVDDEIAPEDMLPHGNRRPGSERLWSLTDAGQAELDRLERLA